MLFAATCCLPDSSLRIQSSNGIEIFKASNESYKDTQLALKTFLDTEFDFSNGDRTALKYFLKNLDDQKKQGIEVNMRTQRIIAIPVYCVKFKIDTGKLGVIPYRVRNSAHLKATTLCEKCIGVTCHRVG